MYTANFYANNGTCFIDPLTGSNKAGVCAADTIQQAMNEKYETRTEHRNEKNGFFLSVHDINKDGRRIWRYLLNRDVKASSMRTPIFFTSVEEAEECFNKWASSKGANVSLEGCVIAGKTYDLYAYDCVTDKYLSLREVAVCGDKVKNLVYE